MNPYSKKKKEPALFLNRPVSLLSPFYPSFYFFYCNHVPPRSGQHPVSLSPEISRDQSKEAEEEVLSR